MRDERRVKVQLYCPRRLYGLEGSAVDYLVVLYVKDIPMLTDIEVTASFHLLRHISLTSTPIMHLP